MAKPELGTKRTCPSCGAKFYDLHKNPIECPKCEHSFITEQQKLAQEAERAAAEEAKVAAAAAKKAADEKDESEIESEKHVSFEDADSETKGAKGSRVAGLDEDDDDDDESDDDYDLGDAAIDVDDDDDDDDDVGLLDDDDDDDVSSIIDADIDKED